MESRISLIAALACIAVVVFASGCTSDSGGQVNSANNSGREIADGLQKVEIIHFHGTHQCSSCITVGKYAEETVSEFFPEEVAQGKVSFMHVNADLPENANITSSYGAAGSALFIGVYDQSGFHPQEDMKVWYKIGDEAAFKEYLKGVIEEKLGG
jgi:hypothetical protein